MTQDPKDPQATNSEAQAPDNQTPDTQTPGSESPASPIWTSTLDDRYTVNVVSTAHPRRGRLIVMDTQTGETLLDEEVPLSYGAVFGPDVMDVDDWQQRVISVIDG